MRSALAERDIATVFRLLQRVGVAQRRIAALTGQSQSEISEILSGRQVVSYDLLVRIADGLGVPRGQLGLAYDESTAHLLGAALTEDDDGSTDLLARLTELTVGAAPPDVGTLAQPFVFAWVPEPEHVGLSDVARLEAITARLRAADSEHGGGACRDAALAQVAWAQQLLRGQVAEDATRALHLAVADLHVLAGWASFDIGMTGPARRHLARALEHARFVEEPSLVAKVLYGLGRLHLHHGWWAQSVRLFQLGQLSAQQSGQGRAAAMLYASEAWAHALLGETRLALANVERARDEYARGEKEPAPTWLAFFNSAELQALRATTLAFLPAAAPHQLGEAIERLTLSTALRELTMVRSRAFELITLAFAYAAHGDLEQAAATGATAVDLVGSLRSRRVVDRLAPLRAAAARHPTHAPMRELVARIDGIAPRT
jgi:transcriptional regulator with XRE-family HTH domain